MEPPLSPREQPPMLEVPRQVPWNGIISALVTLLVLGLIVLIIKPGASIERWVLVAVVVAALAFDFVNGMNDSANAIATVISTRVLTPLAALIMAAVLNFVGAVLFEGVAKTIAGKLVENVADVSMLMVFCGLVGAVLWSWLVTLKGLPISLSHALIGGQMGAYLVAQIALKWSTLKEIFTWMIIAPVLGLVSGFLLMLALMWIFHRTAPYRVNKHFRFWQIISSGFMAFSHGANDAQKAMGIITLALVAANVPVGMTADGPAIPLWVKIACASVIAIGTGAGGWNVIRTLGHKMIKLMPVHGFAAETAAAGTITLATALHMPVSTTHVITASIMGVGASKRLSAVRWGVASNIIFAWIFTIPACAAVAAFLYALVRWFGLEAMIR
jgi:PiT family inorganic phosphate transporter